MFFQIDHKAKEAIPIPMGFHKTFVTYRAITFSTRMDFLSRKIALEALRSIFQIVLCD
jgi:hypothetical protein